MKVPKSFLMVSATLICGLCNVKAQTAYTTGMPIQEVSFTDVHIDDHFWAPRIETNRKVSIPSALKE